MSGPYRIEKTTLGLNAPDVYKKETKKMNFLQRWFDKKVSESWYRAQQAPANPIRLTSVDEPGINSIDGLSIRLYGATGGQIVEFRKYNRHKDHTDVKLYVINAEQNFSEELAKIVSLEMLR
jgi:hypothetical protein